MLNHIKADLYRITKKTSLYIMMGLFTVTFLFAAYNFKSMPSEFPEFIVMIAQMSPILIGIFIFNSVYNDDLKSHTSQTAIGFGRKRTEIVITKLIEAAIILLFFYIYVFIHILLVNALFSFGMNFEIYKFIGQVGLTYFLITLIYFSLASIINFGFQNGTFSIVFIILAATNFIEQIYGLLTSVDIINTLIGWFNPYLIPTITQDFLRGLSGSGSITTPLIVIAAYLIGSVVASCALFNRVELEF